MSTVEHLPGMGQRVEVDYDNKTVTATRTLRESGGSTVITIPPEVMDIIGVESGEDLVIFAEHETGQITISKSNGEIPGSADDG